MAFTVFESTNMASTKYAERIYDAIATTDIENGTFGYLDGLADNEDVVYNFVAGVQEGNDVVVADNPAWDVDNSKITNQRKDKYIIPRGTRFRVRVVKKRDEFAISIDGFTEATKEDVDVDAYVTIDNTTGKLVASDSKTDDAVFEGKILRKKNKGGTLITTANTYGYSRVMYVVNVLSVSKAASASDFATTSLSDLTDVDLSTAATNGQVLKYNATSGKWEAADDEATVAPTEG